MAAGAGQLPGPQARTRNSRTARRVVLACLMSNAVWPIIIPIQMTDPPGHLLHLICLVGLLLATAGMVLMLYAAVTEWVSARVRRLYSTIAVGATILLWYPAYVWALPGHAPWAWLAGLIAGTLALAWPWKHAAILTAAFTVAAIAGAVQYDASVPQNVLTVWGAAALIVVMLRALVWLLKLLEDAEQSQSIQAELALADERLRMGRELHDVLGHRLAVIALKAELAAELSHSDHTRARAESEAIQQVAATTLGEVRRALTGETVTSLHDQLRSAGLVLDSAGVGLATSIEDVMLTEDESRLLAAVLREGITNALRHGRLVRARVRLTDTAPARRFELDTQAIDEPDDDEAQTHTQDDSGPHTGLLGLAARCAELGAKLEWGPAPGNGYRLSVTLTDDPATPENAAAEG